MTVTIPIDRLMPMIQAAGAAGQKGVMHTMREKFAQEGISTIFRSVAAFCAVVLCGLRAADGAALAPARPQGLDHAHDPHGLPYHVGRVRGGQGVRRAQVQGVGEVTSQCNRRQ